MNDMRVCLYAYRYLTHVAASKELLVYSDDQHTHLNCGWPWLSSLLYVFCWWRFLLLLNS
jgi:hypothetical protein